MHEAAGSSPEDRGDAAPKAAATGAERERILLLECRLEQLRSALDEARADADRVRASLADAAAREAEHARRYSVIHGELAEARAEVASLHERLGRSEALRAELEGHLFEEGARGEAAELVRLRREALVQRERSLLSERALSRLRGRMDGLLMSRETILARVAEWQRLVRRDGPDAADLGEFISELRREILDLEHRNAAGERKEAALRERLVRAGLDPDAPARDEGADRPEGEVPGPGPEPPKPTEEGERDGPRTAEDADPEPEHAPPGDAAPPVHRTGLERPDLFDAARSKTTDEDTAVDPPASSPPAATREEEPNDPAHDSTDTDEVAAPTEPAAEAATAPRTDTEEPPPPVTEEEAEGGTDEAVAVPAEASTEGLHAVDPAERASAYERIARSLHGEPSRLVDHLSSGLADPDPRVRRRAVLAAATAPRLALRPLLDPLRGDPDPQVRRVVREVLRNARPGEARQRDGRNTLPTRTRAPSETLS